MSNSIEVTDVMQRAGMLRGTVKVGWEDAALGGGSIENKDVCGIGYLGVGKYKAKIKGKHTKEYAIWKAMFSRCYSKGTQTRQPTYVGCIVCKEWHNFQVFAEWYTNHNYFGLGYHLDKDIVVRGNKIYSPETCTLVPLEINSLLTNSKAARGEHPQGVSYHKRDKKFIAQVNTGVGSQTYLGSFGTAEEAFQAYKTAKEKYIKVVANKWRGAIEDSVYENLLIYEIQ